MYYVYILRSLKQPTKHYVGFSTDVASRFVDHNKGKSTHTNKYKPWELTCYFGFLDEATAKDFERYLKTGSGRAFLKHHFIK